MLRLWQRLHHHHLRPLSLQNSNRICLFNKRLVLHRDINQNSLQEAINELQHRLQTKGYVLTLSGRFDRQTEQAVIAFQRANNLFVDGVVGPLTWACLCYPVLSRHRHQAGGESPEVSAALEELRQILQHEGYAIEDNPGCFGKDAEQAVKFFQRKYGLKVDGVVGAITWAVLLGMRQEAPQAFFSFSPPSAQIIDQILNVCATTLGIYVTPYPGDAIHPPFASAFLTAYVLTLLVPFILERTPLWRSRTSSHYFLRYAPYVCTGMFWQPIFKGVALLFDGLIEKF